MSSAKQNHHIARLIVGAMTIDGSLDEHERQEIAQTLIEQGLSELVAYVGAAMEEDQGDFNLYTECDELLACMNNEAGEVMPLVFRLVCDVIAADRFVSERETLYISAMAKRLGLSVLSAQKIFQGVLASHRSRIEISGSKVNEILHPQLKELLSFEGADELVCDAETAQMMAEADQLKKDSVDSYAGVSGEELQRAFAVLGLTRMATMEACEEVWRETIKELDLPKLARMGETFVSAAIARITRINEAYKTVVRFDETRRMKQAA